MYHMFHHAHNIPPKPTSPESKPHHLDGCLFLFLGHFAPYILGTCCSYFCPPPAYFCRSSPVFTFTFTLSPTHSTHPHLCHGDRASVFHTYTTIHFSYPILHYHIPSHHISLSLLLSYTPHPSPATHVSFSEVSVPIYLPRVTTIHIHHFILPFMLGNSTTSHTIHMQYDHHLYTSALARSRLFGLRRSSEHLTSPFQSLIPRYRCPSTYLGHHRASCTIY